MAKKHLGKVKHYRRGGAVSRQKVLRTVTGLLMLAGLFGLGWFLGPTLLDFGTRTWYSLKGGPAGDGPQTNLPPADPAPTPEPTPEPTPVPTPSAEIAPGSWAWLSFSSVSTPERAVETAGQLAAQGVRYAVVTLKDAQGYIYYASQVDKTAPSIAATTMDAAAAAAALRAAGIEPVGGISVFQDPVAPYTDRAMGIYYENTEYFWLDAARDAGGKPWLDPFSEEAAGYLTSLLNEAQALGYRQLLLSALNGPPTATDRTGYKGAAAELPARLAALLADWQQDAESRGGAIWVEYPLAAARGEQTRFGGGRLSQIGVKNLVLQLPQEMDEAELDALMADGRGMAMEGGTAHLVLRTGGEAVFDPAFG